MICLNQRMNTFRWEHPHIFWQQSLWLLTISFCQERPAWRIASSVQQHSNQLLSLPEEPAPPIASKHTRPFWLPSALYLFLHLSCTLFLCVELESIWCLIELTIPKGTGLCVSWLSLSVNDFAVGRFGDLFLLLFAVSAVQVVLVGAVWANFLQNISGR